MKVIEVKEVSKKYKLGEAGTGSLKGDIMNMFSRSKSDPNSEIKSNKEFWALKNVSFDVNRGDAIGIIGKNGAGKSTLLKILSRITAPTHGHINVKGRIASLLEVGTGFHPELSGRDNIFLNGAILGMKKAEIASKFDEIVAFSGIQNFIDTPVKRYSSGMYVRLAFAVAAHLEPEILIIDEVLAVGDAEFQKKCLGKMQDVAGEGRTVLFVSHNIQAVETLCNKGVFLKNGTVITSGNVNEAIDSYLGSDLDVVTKVNWDFVDAPGNEFIKVKSAEVISLNERRDIFDIKTPIKIKYDFWNLYGDDVLLNYSLHFYTAKGEVVFNIGSKPQRFKKGLICGEVTIPANLLNDGNYYISMMIVKDTSSSLFFHENALKFEVNDYREGTAYFGKWAGIVRPTFIEFTVSQPNNVII